jgi:hypothetical protein
MEHNTQQKDWYKTPSRKTLRLTFRLSEGKLSLISHQRLNMICPPVVGDKPEKGRHGGFWVELLDEKDQMLFHRSLPTMLNSVEVHSPDGKIRREFGDGGEQIFEVLVPDDESAAYISLVGEDLTQSKDKKKEKLAPGSTELARFEIPKSKEGGKP